MIQGVIFDMDGTLLDTMYYWDKVWEEFLRNIGKQPEEGLGKKMLVYSMPEGAAYIQKRYGLGMTEEEILQGVEDVIAKFYADTAELKAGVRQFIEKLREHGIPMVLATSTARPHAEAAFRRLGVLDDFKCILTSAEVGIGKTEPDIYLKAAEIMGSSPEHTWVFEDALHAAATAKRAGFNLVGIYDEMSIGLQYDLRDLSDHYILDFEDFDGFYQKAMK